MYIDASLLSAEAGYLILYSLLHIWPPLCAGTSARSPGLGPRVQSSYGAQTIHVNINEY